RAPGAVRQACDQGALTWKPTLRVADGRIPGFPPFASLLVLDVLRDAVAELRLDVFVEHLRRLDHVAVGVDDERSIHWRPSSREALSCSRENGQGRLPAVARQVALSRENLQTEGAKLIDAAKILAVERDHGGTDRAGAERDQRFIENAWPDFGAGARRGSKRARHQITRVVPNRVARRH